jgi:glycerophosphoryl diester phosphodiesterase
MDRGSNRHPPKNRAEGAFHRLAGRLVRRWPRPAPPPHILTNCRLVSHRGEHDNRTCLENTLAAFDKAAEAGVWGLEMDVRWTRDLVPVVIHDAQTGRLFERNVAIGQMDIDTVKKVFPQIPTLAEVVARYGGRRHLMLEIKAEPYPRPADQSRFMRRQLQHLEPGRDFHLMSLEPGMFGYFDFLPGNVFVPIARLRIDRFSRLAASRGWGGLAGHFLVAANGLIRRHHELGQRLGTGFADSRACLYREAARGVDWIFSNRAVEMQAVCDEATEGQRATRSE